MSFELVLISEPSGKRYVCGQFMKGSGGGGVQCLREMNGRCKVGGILQVVELTCPMCGPFYSHRLSGHVYTYMDALMLKLEWWPYFPL